MKCYFAKKCGTKVAEPSTVNIAIKGYENAHSAKNDIAQGHSDKPRKGMKILSIVCGVFAVIYTLISIITEPFVLSMTAFFGTLALMFFVLSKSPKANLYILGKQKGLKKSGFVIICVILAFVLFGIIGSQTEMSGTSNNPLSI